jgi:mono/diheme cytochrome c family protein
MTRPPRLPTGRFLPVVLSLLLLAGCDWWGKPDPEKRPVPANEVLKFAVLYEQNCAGCHGAEGKLGPAPPLNDPLFLSIIPDAQLLRVIRQGRRGTPMAAFVKEQGGPLTDDQVKALVKGIRAEWGKQPATAKGKAPPYLAKGRGSVERGKEVFMRACMVCHGDEGAGVEKDGRLVLRIRDPAFLALISDQALRRIAITGRPDLGMPNYAEPRPDDDSFKPLTAAEVDDVVALLASWAPERPDRGKGKRRPAGPAKGAESRGGK